MNRNLILILCCFGLGSCYVRPIYTKKTSCGFNYLVQRINDECPKANRFLIDIPKDVDVYKFSMEQLRMFSENVLEFNMFTRTGDTTNGLAYLYKLDSKNEQDLYLVVSRNFTTYFGKDPAKEAWLITVVSRPSVLKTMYREELAKQAMLPVRIILQHGKWIEDDLLGYNTFSSYQRFKIGQRKVCLKTLKKHYPMECGANTKIKISKDSSKGQYLIFLPQPDGSLLLSDIINANRNKIGLNKPIAVKPEKELGSQQKMLFNKDSTFFSPE